MPKNTYGQDLTMGGSPVPTVPTQPTSTPTQPSPAITINNNPAPIPTQPTTPTTPTTPTQPTGTTGTTTQATSQGTLTMPQNGSVVDLLNAAGTDSSFAARTQLAQQYGIQNYSGTAAQNTDLAKKYLDAFNANKSSPVPDTGAQARSALGTYFDENQTGPQQDPTKQFIDTFASMNPIESNIFQQLSTLASTPTNQQSLTDFYKQEIASQGIPELNMELADINKVMNGTEDDIRSEITHAGGFATESQVQALTAARNKTLLKKATYLSDVINAKNDYVDRIVSLTQADRKQVSDDLDRKLGLTKTLFDMADKMQNNAKENYQQIIDSVGWGGLASAVKGNASQTQRVEQLFGLAPGELQALAAYKKPLTAQEELQNKNLELQGKNLELQNQRLFQDLHAGPTSPNLQFVSGTSNQPGGVFNPKTGSFTPFAVSSTNTMQLAQSQENIGGMDSLLQDPNLNAAVGPNPLARFSLSNLFTGGKSNFISGVEQVRQQLTLDNLVNAKANGATFGALSEGELGLLSASASKLGTWAIKDEAGNVVGYNIGEADFKKELDKINNFAKLDYLLKGGDPTSIGAKEMADGTIWVKNSDGTFTQIK